ncbi:MAG: hypothetical protein ACRDGE_08340 [Candidatus Limnocylindria bacterium]
MDRPQLLERFEVTGFNLGPQAAGAQQVLSERDEHRLSHGPRQ